MKPTPPYYQLENIGIRITPQDGKYLPLGIDSVVYSTAIESDNPELVLAQNAYHMFHRAEFNQLMRCPTYSSHWNGWKTTTGLLGYIFERAQLNPTVTTEQPSLIEE